MTTGGAYRKQADEVPDGYFEWEAAGLRWLAAADGAPVVQVLDVGDRHLDLQRLESVAPSRPAAREFGAALACTHDAGAPAFGCQPDGFNGQGFFGPTRRPLPLRLGDWSTWGQMYAEARVEPMVRMACEAGVLEPGDLAPFDRLCARLVAGEFDTEDSPSRIHGDLWSGNLMWTPDGVVLIDPSAHGGHRETDLALLALFDCPRLEEIVDGYADQHPLAEGWQERIGLHQLHCLLVHAVIFGGAYASQALRISTGYA